MSGYCHVCKIRIREEDNITVHRLPRNKKRKAIWFAFVGHEITETGGLCSRHFKKSDFVNRTHGNCVKRCLKRGACPSVQGHAQNTGSSRTKNDSQMDIVKNEMHETVIIDETKINSENLMAIEFKSETDPLIIGENDNMEISIILGNKVQQFISTEKTIINTNLINTELKGEIDDPLDIAEHDTNMEANITSKNEILDSTNIDDTAMSTNSTDIPLKRKKKNSALNKRRRNPRYVGDLGREHFTSDECWQLFTQHLASTRVKVKSLNQKIAYLNKKIDRLQNKELIVSPPLSDNEEDLDNNSETGQKKVQKVNCAAVATSRWEDEEFKLHFRLSKNNFELVLSLIAPKLKRRYPGLEMVSSEKQFLITLWRMGTPEAYKSICVRFGVSRSTALSTTRRVTKALADLAPKFIKWPKNVQAVWTGFEAISGFPKVIGAMDSIYINIPSPRENAEAFVDKKGHYSVQLQGICDHEIRFTHCHIGHAGSAQGVFLLSEIHDALGKPEKFPDDCYLVGDAAYKLHDNLMIPYRNTGQLTKQQKNYNSCHSVARIAIVKAFNLLKERFQSLLHLPMARTDLIDHFLLACCVLHNICMSNGDDFNIPKLKDEIDTDIPRQEDNAQGTTKRDLICEKLPMRQNAK